MPSKNNDALYQAEMNRRAPGVAPKFAEHISVSITPDTHGEWEKYKEGIEVWRLRIYSKGAKSLNLGFTKFNMPENGSLFLYPMGQPSEILGPFTPMDNEEHSQLWTPIVKGEELVIEVQVPTDQKDKLELELSSVNHDFIGFSQQSQSGSCNLDVVCGEDDGWGIVDGYRDIIRSVAVISLGGNTFCTGFLINNVNDDCTPYFITAEHCGISSGNAPSLVTYWNFENSTCRQPNSSESGGNGDGELLEFNTGSIWRSAWAPSDFTLVELDDPVDEGVNAFFAGWSNEFIMPTDTIIGVHHPSTDEKRISFDFDALTPGSGGSQTVNINLATHVIVQDWDIGTTEGGSSGSPLFNKKKQVVGQLTGGGAACGNNFYDTYGWFNTSWEGGGTQTTALSFWLDPDNTGAVTMDGKECNLIISSDIISSEICGEAVVEYNLTVSESFDSDVTLSTVDLPEGITATFDPNPASPGTVSKMTISNTSTELMGDIQINAEGTDGENTTNILLGLTIIQESPEASTLLMPADGMVDGDVLTSIIWNADDLAKTYLFELALEEDFTTLIHSGETEDAIFNTDPLESLTTYYWRVKGVNICGEGPWSETWSFTTASCGAVTASGLPIEISSGDPSDATSTLIITSSGTITDLNVIDLDIPHTFVGDLTAILESPSGTEVLLFERPGIPGSVFGCGFDNMFVSFDDQATNTADLLENACEDGPIAIMGTFQPIDPLSSFEGEDMNGTWTLTISDGAGDDGGSIDNWSLSFCSDNIINTSITPSANQFNTCVEDIIEFDITIGSGFESSGVNLSATGNPTGSTVVFGSNPANPGESVSVEIMNIDVAGDFEMTIHADDGVNNTETLINVEVKDITDETTLNAPTDNAINIALIPTFEWAEVESADSYELTIATDMNFTSNVETFPSATESFTLSANLMENTTYFWQVTSINECGNSVSSTNSFVTEDATSVDVWEQNYISVVPNPSNGLFTINHNQATQNEELVQIYSIDGKTIKTYKIDQGSTSFQIDLTAFNSGIYFLRISSPEGSLTKKLLMQN